VVPQGEGPHNPDFHWKASSNVDHGGGRYPQKNPVSLQYVVERRTETLQPNKLAATLAGDVLELATQYAESAAVHDGTGAGQIYHCSTRVPVSPTRTLP